MPTIIRALAMFATFAALAVVGGTVAGIVIGMAGVLFYHTGFQFPLYFYGSLGFIALSLVKHYVDCKDAKPKPVEEPMFIESPNPRTYRQGHLIFS